MEATDKAAQAWSQEITRRSRTCEEQNWKEVEGTILLMPSDQESALI
jgi:hypothetical protein